MPNFSIRQAWLVLIAGVLALALVPAGLALDRQLARELERQARADLAAAPKVLSDRNETGADAMMMHAKELAAAPGLADAVAAGRADSARRIARASVPVPGEEAVVAGPDGKSWLGPALDRATVAATREGRMPVRFAARGDRLLRVAVAPLEGPDGWTGAAGVTTAVGEAHAATVAGLTQSDVALFTAGGALVATTVDSALPPPLADSVASWAGDGRVHEIEAPDGGRHWAAVAELGGAGSAVFLRSAREELSILPDLRRSALLAGLLAVAVAMLLGGYLATRMARPVQRLAEASQRLADGDFEAPLPSSRVRELRQVRSAFESMRGALRQKIAELTEANEELAERQERLQALQSELIQRDRMAATGRLVTKLAHEIRNPVASVRNCLEIIHDRLDDDADLREFSEMAIDELLRMHRLSEQMLDANRPLDPEASSCSPRAVAENVAKLTRTADDGDGLRLAVSGDRELEVEMGPDALKQVLLNLVENAREAVGPSDAGGGRLAIRVRADDEGGERRILVEVVDDGPGIDEDVRSRIFDPFFTTKDEVHGVGLGLFVAQGLVRRHGGSLSASNREEGGARFTVALPPADGAVRPAGEEAST